MSKGFDPLESAKVTPAAAIAAMPPPPPPSSANVAAKVPSTAPTSPPVGVDPGLEAKRHAREGTPATYPERPTVQVHPPQPPKPRPGKYYRVKKSQVINLRGNLTTLAKGSIVSEYSHDLEALTSQNVEWEPVDP